MPVITINAGLSGWYGSVTAEPSDTREDRRAAAAALNDDLVWLTSNVPRRAVSPQETRQRRPPRSAAWTDETLPDAAREALTWIQGNPDVVALTVVDKFGAKLLNRLRKHGFVHLDTAKQRFSVLERKPPRV
jgi:hypothetical protein